MKYRIVNVSETELEELIRQEPDGIEVGLKYIDHQVRAGRGPLDVLFVDSGRALVVAELKVVEDEHMLMQGLDYYNYIAENIEGLSRAYKKFKIDPKQEPRLLLIAPAFSNTLVNRCKWLSIPISIFSFQCIELQTRKGEVTTIFKEITVPPPPEIIEIPTIEENLNYITDTESKKRAQDLLEKIKQWGISKISVEAIKYDISLKISGRVFGYLSPRRKFCVIYTWDDEDQWRAYHMTNDEELEQLINLLKHNVEQLKVDLGIK